MTTFDISVHDIVEEIAMHQRRCSRSAGYSIGQHRSIVELGLKVEWRMDWCRSVRLAQLEVGSLALDMVGHSSLEVVGSTAADIAADNFQVVAGNTAVDKAALVGSLVADIAQLLFVPEVD